MDPLHAVTAPTASRPMLGLTILAVEDSLYASEALRLLCLRSGARIRRADCLRSARRHLEVYRPSVAIVDLGLPDGSGAELVSEMVRAVPRVSVVAAISGDPGARHEAEAAGADVFLSKPLTSLATFQETLLSRMPAEYRRKGPRPLPVEVVEPDPVAYVDDMAHAAEMLQEGAEDTVLAYLGQFLCGVARCAGDTPLLEAALRLESARSSQRPLRAELSVLAGMLQDRIGERIAI
ncbi:response regulator [Pseudooceanicola sp. CBS1P-1]|uniref:Response regulator n=1 Tax=Pseudooceanicola albus TaxID=2692189 RepID=A0A6L7G330_9RHOB|nr:MULTISPECIES: response regulator [Pseudooceanicola]MBT9384618.1 response regulator [Pseudooceanicola endophyticus]MXN18319.1 response regulator [Pseudooceanicola albus]